MSFLKICTFAFWAEKQSGLNSSGKQKKIGESFLRMRVVKCIVVVVVDFAVADAVGIFHCCCCCCGCISLVLLLLLLLKLLIVLIAVVVRLLGLN